MSDHCHAFRWLGSRAQLADDAPRRPGRPGFEDSPVAPLDCVDWLLKPRFAEGTFTDPVDASSWFSQRLLEYGDLLASARDRDTSVMLTQLADVAADVEAGRDAVGEWYLTDERFLQLCLIACPHPDRPEYPCPQPPS